MYSDIDIKGTPFWGRFSASASAPAEHLQWIARSMLAISLSRYHLTPRRCVTENVPPLPWTQPSSGGRGSSLNASETQDPCRWFRSWQDQRAQCATTDFVIP